MRVSILSTVRAKLFLLTALYTATVFLLGIYSFKSLNAVKVGGPLYERITQTMDIRADILPPPQYLIETELTAFQMVEDASANPSKSNFVEYEKKLKQLRKDFEDGQAGWSARLPSDTPRARNIRALLLEKNNDSGEEYFKILFGDFLTAIQAHDLIAARKLLQGTMGQLAAKHRSVIDQLTALTDESSREDEAFAKEFVRSRVITASVVVLAILGLAIFYSFVTVRSIASPLADSIRTVKQLENGNLTASVNTFAKDELGQMCQSLNRAIESFRITVRNTVQSSENLGTYSRSLSAVAASVSSGILRQASNLQETSTQLAEVATLSQSIATGGREAQEVASRSRDAADQGVQVVQSAIAGMTEISKAAQQINQIVDAVDEIGFNTNLLAVNAAIEAEVAGEQGRGFKVVAEEIRSLSLRTATAGKKIRSLIQETQEAIHRGTERVQASGCAFDEINAGVRKLKAIMDDIAASSTTQADALQQLNEAVSNIADVVEQNSVGTETVNKTSKDLAAEAQNMHMLVGTFQVN